MNNEKLTSSATNPLNRIRPDIQAMQAYAVQDSTGMVKLDAMENPFSLPEALQTALGKRLGAVALNRYPGKRIAELRSALAEYAALPTGCSLMLGNGSDELISLLAMACDRPGACIVAPVPGFVMYAISAQLQGMDFVGVPLTADFELDTPAMLAAIEAHRPAITYLAYPNNPTANLWNDQAIDQIIESCGKYSGLVVIDEAYQPFSSKSYLQRMQQHPHVVLLRTLSKFGLAGVRLGYLMGSAALIAEIDKTRPPYNISSLNAECALFALEHREVFAAQAAELIAQRTVLQQALASWAHRGVTAWPSEANMILVRVPDANRTFADLIAHGILVKNVSKMHPLLANCLRMTVSTAAENQQLIAALELSI